MCGIFALLNNWVINNETISDVFQLGSQRGPEYSVMKEVNNVTLGFHRLAINGLNPESHQPIVIGDVSLICNGEIYNYKELYEDMGITPKTGSDCEIIIHMYLKYGINHTLQCLDGVFAFVLLDKNKMFIGRDPYGVRPLYYLYPESVSVGSLIHDDILMESCLIYGFASEMKQLVPIAKQLNQSKIPNELYTFENTEHNISQFSPGTYMYFEKSNESAEWIFQFQHKYFTTSFSSSTLTSYKKSDVASICKNIRSFFVSAVFKRCIASERPIACLLSGGLDSSLVAALVNEYHKSNNLPTLETFSIGLKGSVDLENARIVADYLQTKHTSVEITEEEYLNAIAPVIYNTESYDTTTIRASIGNWLIGKYIEQHSDAKVIFNGDGADELMGGYLYFRKAGDPIEFDRECRQLLKKIHTFDVLRSDKCISSHGLEPRTPFLDREWTQYYLSIPARLRYDTTIEHMEKYLIRKAFSSDEFKNINGEPLIPESILWRRKEAFSDGVTGQNQPISEIIENYANKHFMEHECSQYPFEGEINNIYQSVALSNTTMPDLHLHNLPRTAEQYLYRLLFEMHYPGFGRIIPRFWMPKYVDATDASARTLELYSEVHD